MLIRGTKEQRRMVTRGAWVLEAGAMRPSLAPLSGALHVAGAISSVIRSGMEY